MSELGIIKSYRNGLALTEAMLDDFKGSIEDFFNDGIIDEDNIQNDAIIAAKIASTAVTSTKLTDSCVTTAKITDANVTRAKLSSVNDEESSGSSATITDVDYGDNIESKLGTKYLSTTITTSGRPVMLMLQSSANTGSYIYSDGGYHLLNAIAFVRGSTQIAIYYALTTHAFTSTTEFRFMPNSYKHIDTPVAGTYTYTVRVAALSNFSFSNVKLLAYEL